MTAERAVMRLALDQIGELPADQYVGLIDESAIECLKVRIEAEGLLTPIWVRRNGNAGKPRWSVIAGRHRLRAMGRLRQTEIEAVEYAGPTSGADELRGLQVAENLDRRILRPIERACHVMERWIATAAAIVPSIAANRQSEASRVRWSAWEIVSHTSVGDVRSIDEATAAACVVTDRTVRSYRKLHVNLVLALPDLFAQLNAHPLGESLSAMRALARIANVDERREVAQLLLSRADWESMDAVLVAAERKVSPGFRVDPDKTGAVLLDAWASSPLPGRQAHLDWLVLNVTPGQAVRMVDGFRREGKLP